MKGQLRDLIYFDFNKAASLFSQVEGGLLKEVQEKAEDIRGRNASGNLDLKVVKGALGSDSRNTTSILESRVLHHDLLTRLENWLKERGQLIDLNVFADDDTTSTMLDFSDESIRKAIKNPTLLTAEGWAEFQDFARLSKSGSKINELVQLFARMKVEESREYRDMKGQLAILKQSLSESRNRDAKAKINFQIKTLEKEMEELIDHQSELIPASLLEAIGLITDTFMPNRLQLRIYPFLQNPRFSVMANLKRDCFLDADFENVLFAYGTRPNALLTVLGLTTSVPTKDPMPFDPENFDQQQQLESGFRQMFSVTEKLESLGRFSYYPNVTVYPIAVYQRLGELLPNEEGRDIDGITSATESD